MYTWCDTSLFVAKIDKIFFSSCKKLKNECSKRITRKKVKRCECECSLEHSTEITTQCDSCERRFCDVCAQSEECFVIHRDGTYCWWCEDSMRLDTFGNTVSFSGECVKCGVLMEGDYCERCCSEN